MVAATKIHVLRDFERYLLAEKYLSRGTVTNRLYEIRIFLAWLGEDTRFEQADFTQYLAHRSEKRVLERSYTNKIMFHLVSFYQFLGDCSIAHREECQILDRAIVQQKIPDVLHLHEYAQVESCFGESVTDLRDAAILEAIFSTGMRVSECLSLLKGQFLGETLVIRGKGDKERIVFLNGSARKKISRYLEAREKESLLLFCNAEGNKLTRQYVHKMVRDVCLQAGITKKISPHSFRHSFATLLYEGGANLIQIRDLLGHSSVTTTERYTRMDVRHLRVAISRHPRNSV